MISLFKRVATTWDDNSVIIIFFTFLLCAFLNYSIKDLSGQYICRKWYKHVVTGKFFDKKLYYYCFINLFLI